MVSLDLKFKKNYQSDNVEVQVEVDKIEIFNGFSFQLMILTMKAHLINFLFLSHQLISV